jgi:hypothetical protein
LQSGSISVSSSGTVTGNYQTKIWLFPMGVGDTTSLSRSGSGGANWDRVDEYSADNDTTYVYYSSSSSNYIRDTYATQDSPVSSGTINSVTIYINCKYTSGTATPNARTVLRISSSYYTGTDITLTGSYTTYSTTYNSNPAGGLWTWSAINALQCGVDLKRTSGGGEVRCTQVYIVVMYTP